MARQTKAGGWGWEARLVMSQRGRPGCGCPAWMQPRCVGRCMCARQVPQRGRASLRAPTSRSAGATAAIIRGTTRSRTSHALGPPAAAARPAARSSADAASAHTCARSRAPASLCSPCRTCCWVAGSVTSSCGAGAAAGGGTGRRCEWTVNTTGPAGCGDLAAICAVMCAVTRGGSIRLRRSDLAAFNAASSSACRYRGAEVWSVGRQLPTPAPPQGSSAAAEITYMHDEVRASHAAALCANR